MRYVAGFLFSPDQKKVVLIKKARPAWQKGRYNAVGGKIELGETPLQAMQREFLEETGHIIHNWEPVADLQGPDWSCNFFRACGVLENCRTQDMEEPIEIFDVEQVKLFTKDRCISNVPWLMGVALNINAGIDFPISINYL